MTTCSCVSHEYPERKLWLSRFHVVSAVNRFGHESFRPDFRVGRFGLIWWVVSAQCHPPPPIFYITHDTVSFFYEVSY